MNFSLNYQKIQNLTLANPEKSSHKKRDYSFN